MSRYWSPIVHKLQPYVPGEQPKLANVVKLNTNENPYGPSPKVLEAIRLGVSDQLRLYPDPNSSQLKQVLAEYYHVDTAQVFVGNGSDEVLAHIFNALFQHEAPLLFPDITYSFYPVYCQLYQIDYQTIPLSDDFEIKVQDFQQNNGGIIFPNPNAPTGRLLALDEIEQLLDVNKESVVVIDEAYIDFGGNSAISLVNKYPNLLVTQTLSKSRSLAGMRIGFAIGHEDLIEALVRVKDSFNSYPLGSLVISAAVEAFNDQDYFEQTCQKIIASRKWVTNELMALGFEVLPSAANFILAKHPQHTAADLATDLRQQGIIVRHFKQDRISQFLRITIGTAQENQQLLAVLDTLVD
ncbi:MAG: histidinol-phosphate transaminase [Gammaproteobacteria bacterium]|nr:MAG: histidinol-phosphate transaminase [Gammaproteobacteria bacterium]